MEAGARYYDRSAACGPNGVWQVTNTVLAPGLYYVNCDAKVNGADIGGQVTVVAEGTIQVSGSRPAFEPFIDGVLFLAGAAHPTAVTISASASKFGSKANV